MRSATCTWPPGPSARPGSGPLSLTGQPTPWVAARWATWARACRGNAACCPQRTAPTVKSSGGSNPAPSGPTWSRHRRDVRQAAAGDIKACWIICTNPVASWPNRATVINALETAELVIAQDAYRDTAPTGTPISCCRRAVGRERCGNINSERTLTLLQQSVPPVGEARPDSELICAVAEYLGFGDDFAYKSSARSSMRSAASTTRRPVSTCAVRPTSGCARRRCSGPARPRTRPTAPHPLPQRRVSQTLHVDESGHRPTGLRHPVAAGQVLRPPAHGSAEDAGRRLPDGAQHGRLQHQWHTMTKTGRVDKLNKLNAHRSSRCIRKTLRPTASPKRTRWS
jgi:anaerobic selenocysteine-containing dehydrogenase